MTEIPEIQYITRDDNEYSHSEQAKSMFKNGIKWVQIRMKNASFSEVLEQSELAMEYANQFNGKLIINDFVEIAQQVKAHGIHLGLNDTLVDKARKILGDKIIIGGTANSIGDIRWQVSKGADYIGLGPFRYTTTKEKLSPVIGLGGYKIIMKQLINLNISTPVIAVGGILESDMKELIQTGVHGVAVSGALFNKIIKQL